MKQELRNRFDENLALLKSLPESFKVSELKAGTEAFLNFALDLVLLFDHDPQFKQDPDFVSFVSESISLLEYLALDDYIIKLEHMLLVLPLETDEWIEICYRRSRLEAICNLYSEEIYQSVNEHLPGWISELDDRISLVKGTEGYLKEDEIPQGIPKSHWWWF